MKRASLLCLVLLFSALAFGCNKNRGAYPVPTQSDLTGRNWVLMSVDGQAYTAEERVPNLMFGDDMKISGAVCNRFVGQGTLNDHRLTVSQMASTKMFCVDQELNRIEDMFGKMLEAGADLSWDGNLLNISQGGHTLVYRAEPLPR